MTPRAALFILTLSLAVSPFACVLSEPPPLVKPPVRRPTILHGQAYPPENRVLIEDPGTFYVPVEMVEPTVDFTYEVFLDWPYKSVEQARVLGLDGTIPGSTTRPNVQTIPFNLKDRLKDGACHQITFRVGLGPASSDAKSLDADYATWYFIPPDGTSCVPFNGALPDGGYDTGPEVGADP